MQYRCGTWCVVLRNSIINEGYDSNEFPMSKHHTRKVEPQSREANVNFALYSNF